jgi:hypothetical protein
MHGITSLEIAIYLLIARILFDEHKGVLLQR